MARIAKSLNATLAVGISLVLLLVCGGLFLSFDLQSRQGAIDTAQARQSVSLRILVDKFAARFDGIDLQIDEAGNIESVRWSDLSVPANHDLIDSVGQVSGETATLFAWVPEEGDFIRRTTNIVKPDGSRAVGTWLGKTNPVHARMLERRAYNGEAIILGKGYYTLYQPILDAADNVVGIFYVGVDRGVVDQQVTERLFLGLGASFVAMLLGSGLVLLLIKRATLPMRQIAGRLEDMAEGELQDPVPHTDRIDDLGKTARVVESFRNRLLNAAATEQRAERDRAVQSRVVTALRIGLEALAKRNLAIEVKAEDFPDEYDGLRRDFQAGIASLSDALKQAETVSNNVRASAAEIGSTSDDLARRVEMQAATLMQSADALNSLTGTSREIAANVEEADQLAVKSRQLSDESGQVVQDAIAAINRIEDASDKINQIITAIDDIAFQTNLLALNAGVEAARAGDAGKGFAVVASEVRSLAQTAANSAQEIKTLITRSGEEVSEGSRLVQKTGASLSQVQEQVESLGQLISNIAGAVRVQTDGLANINEGVQRLEGATQENAAIVEELNAAGQSLNIEAERLADSMGVFAHGGEPAEETWSAPQAQPKPSVPTVANRAEPDAPPKKKAVNAPELSEDEIKQPVMSTQTDTDWGEEF